MSKQCYPHDHFNAVKGSGRVPVCQALFALKKTRDISPLLQGPVHCLNASTMHQFQFCKIITRENIYFIEKEINAKKEK